MIQFGMDWYPEQWDVSYWEDDIKDMKEMGIDLVRIGEFSWSQLEPEEGNYNFEWLDRVMDLLEKYDMKVILGTPTNCPPIWMYKNYPEVMRHDATGQKLHYGLRGHRCYTSKSFREFTRKIIQELTARYKDRPMLCGWQIDNELDANNCTCPSCKADFIQWLKKKYGTLENLNQTYGLAFWSGEFSDWEQINLERHEGWMPGWYNPAFMLDVERWKADSLNDYVKFQKDLLKKATPNLPVTTNFCLSADLPDFHSLSRHLDVASYDNYPPNALYGLENSWMYSNAVILDYVRGFKRDHFWIMEQLAGPMGCWGPVQPAIVPGMLEGYGIQAIAHGCDLEVFFRWRSAAKGAEMFCYGLLDQDNRKNRRYFEIKSLIEKIKRIDDLDTAKIHSDVAVLYGKDSHMALDMQQQGIDYWDEIRRIHGGFTKLGINTDIIEQNEDLEGYKLVVVPSHFIYASGIKEKLEAFAQKGGDVILTVRSGVKDENGNVFEKQVLPSPFSSLVGASIYETDAVGNLTNTIELDGHNEEAGSFCDILEPNEAESVAVYKERFYSGKSAITKNKVGKGNVWYLGSVLNPEAYRKLFERILVEKAIPVHASLPDGIEITRRENKENSYEFIFNNTSKPMDFTLCGMPVHMESLEAKILKNNVEWL